MAANGNLIFQDTNKATFVGANSNVVIDTVNASFGVGVDVNGPTSNLHVVGNAYVTTDLSVGDTLYVDAANDRVGIGTTSPVAKFEVYGNTVLSHGSGYTHNTDDRTLYIGGRNNNGSLQQGKCAIVATPSTSHGGGGVYGRNALHFCVGPDVNNDTSASKADSRLCITHTGNVGIGSSAPTSRLYITQNFGGNGPGVPVAKIVADDGGIQFGVQVGEKTVSPFTRTSLRAVDNGETVFIVDGFNKRVGIGTTNPTCQLDVQGATGFDGSTTFRLLNPASSYGRTQLHLVGRYEGANDGWNSGGARNAIMFKSQSGLNSAITNRWTIQSFPNGTSNDLGFLSGSNNTPRVVFRGTNGNVGIGTTSPDKAKLHVIGSVSTSLTAWYYNASGANAQVANYNRDLSGYFGSHLACAELQVFSDRRIKTEIEDIDDGSALILFRQIQPKTYKYLDKVERGNERVYGFVAQEIKELMPEAVDVSSGKIPNIYEVANVSNSNVITFTHFNTSNLVSNSNILEVQTVHGDSQSLNIAEVVDEHVIRVDEDLSDWIGSVDESGNVASGNQLFVYGQEVNDFHHLKKSAIWTVTTAALQEVDRQQQADKARITELESQLASVLTRLDALENAS